MNEGERKEISKILIFSLKRSNGKSKERIKNLLGIFLDEIVLISEIIYLSFMDDNNNIY